MVYTQIVIYLFKKFKEIINHKLRMVISSDWCQMGTSRLRASKWDSEIHSTTVVSVHVCAQLLNWVWLFVTPWAIASQAPLFLRFPRQKYWSGFPCPSSGDLPSPGIESTSLAFPVLAGRFFTTTPPGKSPLFLKLTWGTLLFFVSWFIQF